MIAQSFPNYRKPTFLTASSFFNQTDHHKKPISATAIIGTNALSAIRNQFSGICFADSFGIFRWALPQL